MPEERWHFDVGPLRLPRYRVEREEAARRYLELYELLLIFALGFVLGSLLL